MTKILTIVAVGAMLAVGVLTADAAEYAIDAAHSQIGFKVKHLSISTVSGRFDTFGGFLSYEVDKLAELTGTAEIDAGSVNTNSEKRDKHLRNKDFFDTETFPKITYAITAVRDVADGKGRIVGSLTMHGVTKVVLLDGEIAGPVKDRHDNNRIAFTASGKLNRTDFGINYGKAAMVSHDITLVIEVEAIEKKEEGERDDPK